MRLDDISLRKASNPPYPNCMLCGEQRGNDIHILYAVQYDHYRNTESTYFFHLDCLKHTLEDPESSTVNAIDTTLKICEILIQKEKLDHLKFHEKIKQVTKLKDKYLAKFITWFSEEENCDV